MVLTGVLIEPAAAARRSTLTNVSDTPVRICLTAVGCSKSTILLKPGQNSRQVLGTKKLRALYVPRGWRAVVMTKGQRVTHRGPVTVRLPSCICRRTVSMTRVPGQTGLGPESVGSAVAVRGVERRAIHPVRHRRLRDSGGVARSTW